MIATVNNTVQDRVAELRAQITNSRRASKQAFAAFRGGSDASGLVPPDIGTNIQNVGWDEVISPQVPLVKPASTRNKN